MSVKEVQEAVLKLKEELVVDKSALLSTVRKLTSAKDDRPSSQAVGSLGIVLLSVLGLGMILADAPLIVRHLKKCLENIRTIF